MNQLSLPGFKEFELNDSIKQQNKKSSVLYLKGAFP